MCALLEVNRTGYYEYLKRETSCRKIRQQALLKAIRKVFEESRNRYGHRRVYQKLRQQGHSCNHKTVEKLMRENNLSPKRKRKFKVTTDSKHHHHVNPNLLNREFAMTKENRAWVSDITYIDTKEGWLYLAVFIDLYTRKIVGWSARADMTVELVLAAYEDAATRTGTTPRLVHSDRGSQYASADFRKVLWRDRCIQSMSRKGNCWDNAVSESFFGSLKSEMIYRTTFETRNQAIGEIFNYIEMFYNTTRLHSALGYLSPAEFALKGKRVA